MAIRPLRVLAASVAALAVITSPAVAQQAPFDWIVPPNTDVYINTATGTISGGDGQISGSQPVIGGLIDVRHVMISASSRVLFLGPHPVTILASGDVSILGGIKVSGTSALGPGAFGGPSPGARGRAGGGDGGDGGFAGIIGRGRGEHGQGGFGRPNAGGRGGESSFHALEKDARRGSGGGGGRFGRNVKFDFQGVSALCQTLIGLDVEPGFPGGENGLGALSQTQRARGGRVGLSPFQDSSPRNDFYGIGLSANGLVVGELDRPWAGSGGGSGGHAIQSATFPAVTSEVAGGGGSGGGSLTILAMGELHVGPAGSVRADGGNGGGGENVIFFDRVGGGGGGGSGGHIILQSALRIRIDAVAANAGAGYDDQGTGAQSHPARPISAVGGQGGVGKNDVGGAPFTSQSSWRCDGIPIARLTVNGVSIPPLNEACFQNLGGNPVGSVDGAGGDGGPGVIQLHVPNPETDLIFGGINDGDLTKVFAPPPFGWRAGEFQIRLLPHHGAAARAHRRVSGKREIHDR